EVVGKRVVEALPEVVDQGFVQILDRVFATRESFVGREISVMLQRVPGEPPQERFLDFVYQPLIESSGVVSGIVAHGNDVTEAVLARQRIEQLLHASEESEERYRFLANAIPVQVWTA